MNIAITGASGFIGRRVSERLGAKGHVVCGISLRSALRPEALAGCDAVIHLAGEPVAQRWTSAVRRKIQESRVQGTRRLIQAMRGNPPQTLISASAVGYYGSRGDEILTETSAPANDFLGQVAAQWEQEAYAAEPLGVRVVCLRLGMVLGRGGGALGKMLLPFRMGLGGRIAGGEHWMSWIHADDLTALMEFLLRESTVRGVLNATSPHPVTNAEFTRALAEVLHRPAFLPVPRLALKLLYGKMSEIVLASQRAVPEAALRAGFTFGYPDVHGALAQIFSD